MKTIIALATLSVVGAISAASAHPLGDGHHFRNGYFVPHGAPNYQAQPYYGQPPPQRPRYAQPAYQPPYTQPTYSPQHYQQPSYPAQPQYAQPQYAQPQYPAHPAYQRGYGNTQYPPQPAYHGGYAAPQPYSYPPGYRASGLADPRLPASEGLNVGYAGGPTFGSGPRRVINGVQIFGPPND